MGNILTFFYHGKSLQLRVGLTLSRPSPAPFHAQEPHVTVGQGSLMKKDTDLSVMMLGFTVTTSVFTPTSMVYFSEIGGRLHLQKRQDSWRQGSSCGSGRAWRADWSQARSQTGSLAEQQVLLPCARHGRATQPSPGSH